MLFFDKLIARGVRFVLDKVTMTVDRELHDPERLRERLIDAEARRDAGEIDQAEFDAIEADVLALLRSAQGSREFGAGGDDATRVADVVIEVDAGDSETPPAPSPAPSPPRPAGSAKPAKPAKKPAPRRRPRRRS